jgi:signal peptidase
MDRKNKYLLAFLAATSFLIIVLIALRLELNVSTPLVIVEGNSMLPTLYNGDLVIIYKPPPSDINVGDIVVYRSPITGRLVIHRVIKINSHDGVSYYYITKGDNNPVDDVAQGLEPPGGIAYEEILGVVISIKTGEYKAPFRIPYLGLLTRMLRG